MIRVLIADDNGQVAQNIARRLALEDDIEVCATATDGESAVQEALWLRPDIAVVDSGLPGLDGVQTTEMLTQSLPGTGVIMMSMEAENDAFRLAMLAGAREFLQKPFRGDELVAAVRRVHAFGMRRATPAVGAAPQTATAAARRRECMVTAVVAGKGGVGKTVVAINLAAALARRPGTRVALVDLSLQFGDVATSLNLKPGTTFADLLEGERAGDQDAVSSALTEGPAGVRILVAPPSTDVADLVTPTHIRQVVTTLRAAFDHVVLDTTSSMGVSTISAIELADTVVVVTDLSAPGVKNTALLTTAMRGLGVDPTHVFVIANHREAAGELASGGAAASYLGAAIAAEIPYDARVVSGSVKQGVPFVIGNGSSRPARALRAIADLVAPVSQVGSERHNADAPSDTKSPRRRRLALRV